MAVRYLNRMWRHSLIRAPVDRAPNGFQSSRSPVAQRLGLVGVAQLAALKIIEQLFGHTSSTSPITTAS
jgi:hypothetical protein